MDDEAQDRAFEARDTATRAVTEIRLATEGMDTRAKELARAQEVLERRTNDLITRAREIPQQYRVHGDLTITEVDSQRKRARKRQVELSGITQQLAVSRAASDKLRSRERAIERQRRASIEQPAIRLHQQIQMLADRSQDAAELLGEPQLPQPTGGGLADDAAWAAAVVTHATQLIRRAGQVATAEDGLAADAETAATEALRARGVGSNDQLRDTLVTVRADAQVAQREIDEATRQQPLAAELDRRIADTRPAVDSLEELGRLLTDGRFIAAVVKRRQRALLGTATSRLMSMTEGRFAFAEDFQIIDGFTGQPRDVKALSGGETFQASLALALAVVELTARAGGHVEALFLDEGFGTLDTNAVACALETLAAQASGGRLVAIISHMRAIADNLDHVLVIDKTFSGSQARWASAEERSEILTEDVAAGLLA